MSSEFESELRVKRVSVRKRSRDGKSSCLTPVKKKTCSPSHSCEAAMYKVQLHHQDTEWREKNETTELTPDMQDKECHSDDDLFGDYDSLANESSFLAKLDDVEHNFAPACSSPYLETVKHGYANNGNTVAEMRNLEAHSDGKHMVKCPDTEDFTVLKTVNCRDDTKPCHVGNTDSILISDLMDDFFDDLPSSQLMLQQENKTVTKQTSSEQSGPLNPFRGEMSSVKEDEDLIRHSLNSVTHLAEPVLNRRRSLKDHLKSTMTGNARAQSPQVSRAKQQKDAVVTKEINLAVKTIESTSDVDLGPFFGLPSKVKELFQKHRGIKELYEWQRTCLTLESVQQRKNLIYSLPTSGGKTLVAEILILRELLCRKKDALFILPYVAIVQEKVRGLASFGLELDFIIEEYAGSKGKYPPIKRRLKNSLFIATIEKGHSLVNSLIEANRLENVGLIVVDELHMLGEGSRGAILEITLAKVLFASKTTQIIGMSATLNNVGDLQKFLKAENYSSDFRPVQLKEYVKLSDCIYEVDCKEEDCFKFSRPLSFKYSSNMKKMDPDHLIALVTEVIPMHSCLMFCPTKKNCENVAGMICKYLNKCFIQHREKEKTDLLDEIRSAGNGSICSVLKRTIPFGIAYHHSGLTNDERKLIEEAYSAGVLCLLTCTSTLAAGVNLPARRVILRSPYVATEFLKRNQYKQMVGRAGRAGIDTSGESILILQEKDKLLAKELVSRPLENCYSNLIHDNRKGLQSLILSLIGLNISRTPADIHKFVSCTLFSVQQEHLSSEKNLWDITMETVSFLTEKGLIMSTAGSHGDAVLEVTKLGRATYKGSIDLSYCDVLYSDLKRGLGGLVLDSILHLIYLVTPYDMVAHCKPDWMIYFRQFTQLTAVEQNMASMVGVPESYIAKKASGQSLKKGVDSLTVNRFYLAFVLFALLKETNVWVVADKFNLARGFVQSLLGSSSAFCSCVVHFTEKLRTLAKGLAPGYLRFGGTKADFMRFHTKEVATRQQAFRRQFGIKPGVCDRRPISPETEEYLKSEWVLQEELILMEEHQNHCSKLNISGSTVDMLYNFANCSGFHLIFGLNALLRTKTNTWNSSNAEELLNYCQSKNYSMSWELGNEPNSFMKKSGIRIDGTQLGKDFVHLREILRRYKNFQDSGLYGPDVGQPRDHTENLLEGFLETGGKVIDACTWHHYYVNGRDTSLSDFLSPEVLDSLATKTQEIFQVVNETVPGKKVWLGETSSAYGGGAPGLSDTYVAGFMWLDKLGLSARLGIDVVIRQVLVGAGSYHLVDSNFDPLPDYWLSLLYKKLVGPKVLAATAFTHLGTESKLHRVYMHCTKSNSQTSGTGAVTVFALNLSKKTSTIHLPPLLSDKTVILYLLEPAGEDGLHSRSVQLNGKVLKMVDDTTLPVLTGIPLPVGSPLKLPALSFAFYVVKDANAPACR